MNTLKLRLKVPPIINSFVLQTEDSLMDTWSLVCLSGVPYGPKTHDIHFEVEEDNVLKARLYPLVPGKNPMELVTNVSSHTDVAILECDAPGFEENTDGDFVWVGEAIEPNIGDLGDPVYDYRENGNDGWVVFATYQDDAETEDDVATVDTETLAKGVVGVLQNTGTVDRMKYLIQMLIGQLRDYSENAYVSPDGTDFAMTIDEIEKEVGLKSRSVYLVNYSKAYRRAGEISVLAYNEQEAIDSIDKCIGDLDGNLEYYPELNRITAEKVDPDTLTGDNIIS